MKESRNLLPKLCLAVLGAILLAAVVAIASSQVLSWNAPGDLLFDQGVVQSLVLGVIPALAVIANLLPACCRAAARRDWLWLAGCVLIWPLSFWYTMIENHGER